MEEPESVSDAVRLLLQEGIQNTLHSFKNGMMHEKEKMNTLLAFYRAMHSMSLNAMKLERSLQGVLIVNSTRPPDKLFREFGIRSDAGLQSSAAEENPDLRLAGRNAEGVGVQGRSENSEPVGESRTPYFILDFGQPKGINMVQREG